MKKLLKKKWMPYLILFIVMFICHLFFKISWGDDIWFKNAINDGVINYIISRYNSWSSRILIELVMILLLQLPKFIWCALDSLIITLVAYSITKLFSIKNNWLAPILVLIYPLYEMSSAGWYATTLNYLWPLAFGLISLFPIKNAINDKKEKNYMYLVYALTTLFSCNQEQMCAIIFCLYAIFIVYLYKKNKLNKLILFIFALSFLSLIFILICPGNELRNISEVKSWYNNYKYFGMFSKIFLGIVTTFIYSVYNLNTVIFILSILLPIFIFKENKNKCVKLISLIPFSIYCMINLFPNIFYSMFPKIGELIETSRTYASSPNEINLCGSSIFIFGISVLFFVSILVSVYNCFKNNKRYLMCLILLAGLASRFIMGFSPTVYASGMRTFLFLDFSVIILVANMLNKKINKNYYLFFIIFILFQTINTMIFSM